MKQAVGLQTAPREYLDTRYRRREIRADIELTYIYHEM